MLSSLSCMDVFSPPLCSCLSTFSSSLPLIPVLLWPSVACSPTDVGRRQALFEVEAKGGLAVVLAISIHPTHFFWIIPTESFKVHQHDLFSNTFCQTHLYRFMNEQGRTGRLDVLEKSAWLVHHQRKSRRLSDIDGRQNGALLRTILLIKKRN